MPGTFSTHHKKPIRQRKTEKTHGEGANPSLLGDPISLKTETGPVPAPRPRSTGGYIPQVTRTRHPPDDSAKGELGHESAKRGVDEALKEPVNGGLGITGKMAARDQEMSGRHGGLKL